MAKVLSVDDSRVVRTMVAKHLAPYGCEVVEAANGEEGVIAAKRECPDLILLDVTMPVMDGRQALAALRQDPATKAIPVIMLTAESGKDLVLEIAKLGVTGYIVKPFTKETFDKDVAKVLGPPGDAPATAPPPRPAAGAPDDGAVLVVDDSERVLEAARVALEHAMRVLTATSGREALRAYGTARPRVVVIDLAMPEMDGFATLEKLRAGGGAESRYIALAVRGDSAAVERARKAGFAAVVEKPIVADRLLQTVRAAVARRTDEAVPALLAEEDGCSVLVFPDPRARTFTRTVPELQKQLKALAEEGIDRVVIDLGVVREPGPAVTTALVRLLTDAATMGLRVAVAAPEAVAAELKQLAEARTARWACDRGAAVQALG